MQTGVQCRTISGPRDPSQVLIGRCVMGLRRFLSAAVLLSLVSFSLILRLRDAPARRTPTAHADRQRVRQTYATLPLSFEANQGQADPRVKFVARANGFALFLTRTEAVVSLRKPAFSLAESRSTPAQRRRFFPAAKARQSENRSALRRPQHQDDRREFRSPSKRTRRAAGP